MCVCVFLPISFHFFLIYHVLASRSYQDLVLLNLVLSISQISLLAHVISIISVIFIIIIVISIIISIISIVFVDHQFTSVQGSLQVLRPNMTTPKIGILKQS